MSGSDDDDVLPSQARRDVSPVSSASAASSASTRRSRQNCTSTPLPMQKPNKIQDLYRQLGGLEARNEMLIDQVKELEQRNRDLEQKKEQLFKDLSNAKLDALQQQHVAQIDAAAVALNFKEDLAEAEQIAKIKDDSLELQLNRTNDEVLVEQQNVRNLEGKLSAKEVEFAREKHDLEQRMRDLTLNFEQQIREQKHKFEQQIRDLEHAYELEKAKRGTV